MSEHEHHQEPHEAPEDETVIEISEREDGATRIVYAPNAMARRRDKDE